MSDFIKELNPVARKPHKCMYCGCTIEPGTRYERQTLKYDGTIYDWICHEECSHVANILDMFDQVDDGLSGDDFNELLNDYINEEYRDPETDDLPEHIQKMTPLERVQMVKNDYYRPQFEIRRVRPIIFNYLKKVHTYKQTLSEYEEKLYQRYCTRYVELLYELEGGAHYDL